MGQSKPGDIIDRAIELAVKAHRKQVRKGTKIAYITHPFAVGVILAKADCSAEVVAAGILHDTVEDGGVNLSRLREEFGESVAGIVEKCTEPDKRRSWSKRKQYILDSVDRAGIEVKFVVCADKLHNIRTLARDYRTMGTGFGGGSEEGERIRGGFTRSLVEALRIRSGPPAYQELYKEFKNKVREVFQ